VKPNITELIVNTDKCIGCGVCSAICPIDILPMNFNAQGNYQPFEEEGCLKKCTLCIDVCPFIEESRSEQEIAENIYSQNHNINYHKDLGYFVNTYEIHKTEDNDRLKSASGGAGNWFSTKILEENIVDYILTVESNEDPDRLFKFSVFSNKEDLKRSRGSVYYPIELSEVLDYVLKNDGRYAISVLPCDAKAIRLAQNKNPKLRKRIKILIGLVCGQLKSKYFAEELGKIASDDEKLLNVNFREKDSAEPSSNFTFKFKGVNGKQSSLKWNTYPSKFWTSRMFTPNACNSCTDVFALNADIILMDAWLPEYTKDYKGHTFVIARTKEVDDIIISDKSASVKKIDYNIVYKSQKNVVTTKNNYYYGNKNFFINKVVNYRKNIQKLSNNGYKNNKEEIDLIFKKIEIVERLRNLQTLPIRIVKKIHKLSKARK